jgi:hypothetical protein
MLGMAWLRGKARAMAEMILEDMVKEKNGGRSGSWWMKDERLRFEDDVLAELMR